MFKRFPFVLAMLACVSMHAQVQPRVPGSSQITTLSGSGSTLATTSGPLTAGNCTSHDANGNLIDSGAACGGGGGTSLLSQKVVYTSKLSGVTGGVAVVPGSSAASTTDSATAINTALAGGNVDLEVDSGYALSTSLVLYSNTTIHCVTPQFGFIMQTAANTPVLINAHTNAPTTTNSTGGYVASNIVDTNIVVRGCTLNANSTQAVTGTNPEGVPHTVTPGGAPGAKFVGGVEFYAVSRLIFEKNECYDSGAWFFFGSNLQYVYNRDNWYHQPLPTVHMKNTSGFQIDGPAQFLYASGNRITAADDSIAYNADDGQVTGSGDPNATYIKSFVKWGDMTDIVDTNEIFDNSFFGLRLLTTNDIIDRAYFSNFSGTICGNTGTFNAAYPGVGPGNLGTISVDGWRLTTTGACNDFGLTYNFNISSNIKTLNLSHVQILNPGVTWPMITQTSGTIGVLSLHDWDLNTQSSGFSNVVSLTGGTIGQILASGINWYDNPAGSAAFFSGSVVPGVLTVSNYAGPNRLLASGFAPAITNGDAFTNTYGAVATTYVNTTFNEAASGTPVAGTTPATCANGCTGAWAASSGGPTGTGVFTYGTNSASYTGACTAGGPDVYCPVTVNPGHTNYTMRANMSAFPTGGGWGFAVRWTNNANFVTWVLSGVNTWALCDVVANVTTCGSNQTLANSNGVYTVVVNGTAVSLTNPSGSTISGTISGSNTTGGAGVNSGAANTVTLTAFSLKSL